MGNQAGSPPGIRVTTTCVRRPAILDANEGSGDGELINDRRQKSQD